MMIEEEIVYKNVRITLRVDTDKRSYTLITKANKEREERSTFTFCNSTNTTIGRNVGNCISKAAYMAEVILKKIPKEVS